LRTVSLSDLVVAYKNGNLSYHEISGRISLFVYDYPRRSVGWSEDECDAFFEFIYHKLQTFVDNYTSADIQFEDYIAGCIKPFMRDFDKVLN